MTTYYLIDSATQSQMNDSNRIFWQHTRTNRARFDSTNGTSQKMNKDVHPSRVVSELPFGFWKYLLSKRYESSLWTQCLRHAFPGLQPQRRSLVFSSVHESHVLRNRIAHHEPIFNRDLRADSQRIFSVLEWIDVTPSIWARSLSRVESIWAERNSRIFE